MLWHDRNPELKMIILPTGDILFRRSQVLQGEALTSAWF